MQGTHQAVERDVAAGAAPQDILARWSSQAGSSLRGQRSGRSSPAFLVGWGVQKQWALPQGLLHCSADDDLYTCCSLRLQEMQEFSAHDSSRLRPCVPVQQEDRLMADRDECGRNRLAHVADTWKVLPCCAARLLPQLWQRHAMARPGSLVHQPFPEARCCSCRQIWTPQRT